MNSFLAAHWRVALLAGWLALPGLANNPAAQGQKEPAQADPDNATWTLTFEGFFPPGKKNQPRPLPVYIVVRGGKPVLALGSAPTYNQTTHTVDVSGLTLKAGELRGRLKVTIQADPWVPKEQEPVPCTIDVQAKVNTAKPEDTLEGTYAGTFGKNEVKGQLTGKFGPPQIEDARNCTLGLILNDTLLGGKENYQRRLAVNLSLADGKVVARTFGPVGLNNKPFDLRPFGQAEVTMKDHGFEAKLTVPYEVLDAAGDPAATYQISVTGQRVNNLVGGTYKVTVQRENEKDVTKERSFKGWVTAASKQEISIWAKDINGNGPWFVPVKGHVPVKPGEHPRLFFRKSDLPELRKRSETPEGRVILTRLRATLGGGEEMPRHYNAAKKAYDAAATKNLPEGAYTVSHAAGFGFLYQLTGAKKYADLARQCVEKGFDGVRDRDDRYSWRAPGGQLRAGPTIGWYALAYDLCYDGWDEAFRKKVAQEIQDYDDANAGEWAVPQGVSLRQLALMPAHMPGSNHWGSQLGAGLAVLAILGDPGTDDKLLQSYLAAVEKNAVRAVTSGFGDGGFFAEGPGPGHMGANPGLVPLFQALKVARGRDYISARPNVSALTMRWAIELIPEASGKPYYPCRKPSSYGSEDFLSGNGGFSHGGWFSQGFGAVTDKQKPALLWVYKNFVARADQNRYDTANYPHRAVLAFLNWPIGVEAKNPGDVLAHTSVDKIHGYYVFRDRWKDADDVVATAWLGSGPSGHINAGQGDVLVWGVGQRLKFGTFPRCQTSYYHASRDGSAVVSGGGTSLAVDYSKSSGADALLVLVGGDVKGAPKASERVKMTSLKASGTTYHVLTLSAAGKHPEAKVEGDKLVVGGQAVYVEKGNLVLAKMGKE